MRRNCSRRHCWPAFNTQKGGARSNSRRPTRATRRCTSIACSCTTRSLRRCRKSRLPRRPSATASRRGTRTNCPRGIRCWNRHPADGSATAMRVISFKNTALFKRGIWLSAAAVIACVAAPLLLDEGLRANPLPNLVGLGALGIFFGYLLWKTQIHRLADEVIDGEDHLRVRRGRTEQIISLPNISTVEVSTSSGIHRITVRLRAPAKLGATIEFLPQASLWSNLSAVQRVASGLAERAKLSRP